MASKTKQRANLRAGLFCESESCIMRVAAIKWSAGVS